MYDFNLRLHPATKIVQRENRLKAFLTHDFGSSFYDFLSQVESARNMSRKTCPILNTINIHYSSPHASSLSFIMQSFIVPNTDYCATPSSTGIEATKFHSYFSSDYQKQVMCAAHPFCQGPSSILGPSAWHRCIGCGLTIHCEIFCGEYWKGLDIFPPNLPQYGYNRMQFGESIPDDAVLCHRCIDYVTQQQKIQASPPKI